MIPRNIFRKSLPDESSPETGGGRQVQDEIETSEAVGGGFFSRVFGVLKGTVPLSPGTDLTSPVGEETIMDSTKAGFAAMSRNKYKRVCKLLLDHRRPGDLSWPWLSDLNGRRADKKSAWFAEDCFGDPDDL